MAGRRTETDTHGPIAQKTFPGGDIVRTQKKYSVTQLKQRKVTLLSCQSCHSLIILFHFYALIHIFLQPVTFLILIPPSSQYDCCEGERLHQDPQTHEVRSGEQPRRG